MANDVFDKKLHLLSQICEATDIILNAMKAYDADILEIAVDKKERLIAEYDALDGSGLSDAQKAKIRESLQKIKDLDDLLPEAYQNMKNELEKQYKSIENGLTRLSTNVRRMHQYDGGEHVSGNFIDSKK